MSPVLTTIAFYLFINVAAARNSEMVEALYTVLKFSIILDIPQLTAEEARLTGIISRASLPLAPILHLPNPHSAFIYFGSASKR